MTTITLEKARHEFDTVFDQVARTRQPVLISDGSRNFCIFLQEDIAGVETSRPQTSMTQKWQMPGPLNMGPPLVPMEKWKDILFEENDAQIIKSMQEWKLPEPVHQGPILVPADQLRELANER